MVNIKAYRVKKQLSQAEFASLLGVSQQAVASWESGERFPRASQIPTIAEVLGCTIDALFGRDMKEVSSCQN